MNKETRKLKEELNVPWITKDGYLDLGKIPIDGILKQTLSEDFDKFRSGCGILQSMHNPERIEAGIYLLGLLQHYRNDLEYDAARKIAQGLGAHLENLGHLVRIQGDTATLLSAGARTRYLFGKDAGEGPKGRKKKKSKQQKSDFMGELKQMEEDSGDWAGDLSGRAGSTVLDQLHQSMILFGAGRGEALKRFLVEDVVGLNPLYWRLAQALSALYPSGTDEKRWVDGVLARKKGLGF